MQRILIKETINRTGEKVKVCGWVNTRRDHGGIVFVDLRDISGLVQIVMKADLAKNIKPEWVICLEGLIKQRPERMVNPKLETGKIEMEAETLEVLAESETPPFEISNQKEEVSEEIRMKYRYLDLRREKMKDNLILRQKTNLFLRNYLSEKKFIEVETPVLTKSTPEGARDFIVPSRNQPGKFYALPQSPQQYKQLLMASGLEKYFQIAKCFRDEDPRGDRQSEFTQLDLEMSFVEMEDVMALTEKTLIELVKNIFPEKKIAQLPFPRLDYEESMGKHGTDRPDIRQNKEELAFCWVINFPFFEKSEGGWTFTHNPFSAPKPEFMADLLAKKNIGNILTTQYDIVLNGYEIGGGSIRNHKPEALEAVLEIMGYKKTEVREKFGHLLEAFKYGVPPHGGIALGLDRLLMILLDEPSIREVIAFPKTGDGRDLMMDSPAEVTALQLKELSITIGKLKTKKKK